MDFYIFLREFSVIWPILCLFGPFFNKMASEKSPEFRANSNDTNLTRRRRTNHAEAPGNIFHFEICILDFGFGVLFYKKSYKIQAGSDHRRARRGFFFLKNSTFLRKNTKYKLGVTTHVPGLGEPGS